MPLLHIIILALVQGITEFLPISSSAHLILIQHWTEGAEQTWDNHLLLDIAVHVGTLFSVLLYFRKDVVTMFTGLKNAATGNINSEESKLLTCVIIGSLPVIAFGILLQIYKPDWMLAIKTIAWTTLIFGIILWFVDRMKPATRDIKSMTIKDAVFIGLSQSLALIPGVSRSGITMTTARFIGFNRQESAHYSLLLGIVAISGAGALGSFSLIKSDDLHLTYDIAIAAFLSFISGYIAITLMMKWLEKCTFTPFAIYRILLGLILLIGIYGGFI